MTRIPVVGSDGEVVVVAVVVVVVAVAVVVGGTDGGGVVVAVHWSKEGAYLGPPTDSQSATRVRYR